MIVHSFGLLWSCFKWLLDGCTLSWSWLRLSIFQHKVYEMKRQYFDVLNTFVCRNGRLCLITRKKWHFLWTSWCVANKLRHIECYLTFTFFQKTMVITMLWFEFHWAMCVSCNVRTYPSIWLQGRLHESLRWYGDYAQHMKLALYDCENWISGSVHPLHWNIQATPCHVKLWVSVYVAKYYE